MKKPRQHVLTGLCDSRLKADALPLPPPAVQRQPQEGDDRQHRRAWLRDACDSEPDTEGLVRRGDVIAAIGVLMLFQAFPSTPFDKGGQGDLIKRPSGTYF